MAVHEFVDPTGLSKHCKSPRICFKADRSSRRVVAVIVGKRLQGGRIGCQLGLSRKNRQLLSGNLEPVVQNRWRVAVRPVAVRPVAMRPVGVRLVGVGPVVVGRVDVSKGGGRMNVVELRYVSVVIYRIDVSQREDAERNLPPNRLPERGENDEEAAFTHGGSFPVSATPFLTAPAPIVARPMGGRMNKLNGH